MRIEQSSDGHLWYVREIINGEDMIIKIAHSEEQAISIMERIKALRI